MDWEKPMNHSMANVAIPAVSSKIKMQYKWGISEASFRRLLYFAALILVFLLMAIFFSLVISSVPALRQFGFSFLIGKTWDPVRGEFGAFAFLVGTLMSSFMALLISMIF